jgi:inorganic triphosphatase YgiF
VADHLETERKYEADPAFVMPPLSGLPGVARAGQAAVYLLAATYYDTPDLRLLSAGVTLRRRTGGTDEGWHLKLPAGRDTRRELHEPLSDQVPPRLAAAAGDLPVSAQAIIESQRTVLHLHGDDDRSLAEVADDLVTGSRLGAGAPPPLSWREIEVEAQDLALLDAAGRLLLSAGARPAESASKLARVLGPFRADS